MGITDVDSAVDAMEVIIHQGEGVGDDRWADPEHRELTHYHKLFQIVEGDGKLGEVRALPTNPRSADFPEDLKVVSDLFNAIYRGLYLVMDRMFAPDGNQKRAVGVLYLLMADVLSQIANFLVARPLGNGTNAAPTFEVYEFSSDSPVQEVKELSEVAPRAFSELNPVHEAIRGLSLIL